ncbi:MAG TPA: DUF167 domain-containing protein [Terriglobia bacterium]|nr:DUF167 domain-containing protein [Terriglobia bacterium]
MPEFQIDGNHVTFWLKVKPRSSRERLTADSSGELRLETHAPPAEGEANEACARFLARELRLPQACVVILAGQKARRKLIRVTGHSPADVVSKISALAGVESSIRGGAGEL